MSEELFTISITERGSFRDCRRAFYLANIRRIEPVVPATHFWFGDLFHAALESYYQGIKDGNDYATAVKDAKETYENVAAELTARMEQEYGGLWEGEIVEEWNKDLKLGRDMVSNYLIREKLEPVMGVHGSVELVEKRVYHTVTTASGRRIRVSGRFDLITRNSDGFKWIVDHKTAKSKPWLQGVELDDQLTGYVWLDAVTSGEPAMGAIYNVALKQGLEIEVLKSGKLSKNKQQKATFFHYLTALQTMKLPLAEYEDFLAELKKRGWSDFFVRVESLRTKAELESFEERLAYELDDVLDVVEDPKKAYPNPGQFKCRGCPYASICKAMENKEDYEYIIEAKFKPRAERR